MAVNRLIRKKASLLARLFRLQSCNPISHDVLWINVNVKLASFQTFLFRKLERLL